MVDVLIIGGGPAGLCASVYARRAGKTVLVLEKESFGGQIATSPRVENFPGIKSIAGLELADQMAEQAMNLGVDLDIDEIKKLTKEDGIFVATGEYSTYLAKSVIIATGCSHRTLDVEGLEEYVGRGVSYCAVCDGSFYENKDVCLIGDANTALQYALMLSNVCKTVYLCTLFDRFFGEQVLVDAIRERSNIKITHNLLLDHVSGNEEIEGATFKDTKTNELKSFVVSGIFIAIGQIPHNEAFSGLTDLDKAGYIITNIDCATKTPGLYAAGDCRQKTLRQVTTAVGDAAVASMQAIRYLDELK